MDYGGVTYCENFKRKASNQERRDKIKKYSLCVKSSKSLHVVKHRSIADCKAHNCRQCGGKHNTLLCMTQTGEQHFSIKMDEDPDKDKEFYEGKGSIR